MKLLPALIILNVLLYSTYLVAQETPPKRVAGLPLSLESYPIFTGTIVSEDGREFPFAYRKPNREGPFPVILYFHGGRGTFSESRLADSLKEANPTRFLNKGYMVVASTRRKARQQDGPNSAVVKTENPKSYSGGMVRDGIAAVKKAKMLSGADPESIVIFGGSVGGSLAIETAAQSTIAAVVAGEPSSHHWMGFKKYPDYSNHNIFPSIYTEERKSFVQSVLGKIDCPILLLGSDPTGFVDTDYSYIMRELVKQEKRAKSINYAGYKHGFYNGGGARQMTAQELDEVIEDIHTFILPHLKTKPKPL